MEVFTIGHSNHSLEDFFNLLIKHQITALADVRSHPYSRYSSHFNRKSLQEFLKNNNIAYVFLGKELGARSSNLSCYINGKAVYKLIANTEDFKQGLERIYKGAKQYKIALMCAEQDPITCHRAILVCRYLQQKGIEIKHILKNGDLENHDDLEQRLLELHHLRNKQRENHQNLIQLSLFDSINLGNTSDHNHLSEKEMIDRAYDLQGDKIAYVDKTLQNSQNSQNSNSQEEE